MPGSNAAFWTEQRVEFLREWRARGAKIEDVAKSLGTTKGAIAGKCKRLNIRAVKRHAGRTPVFVPTPTIDDIVAVEISDDEVSAYVSEMARARSPRLIPTPLLDRKQDQCAAVINTGPHGATMCGEPTISGPWGRTSWCAEHHRLYHRKDDNGQAG